MVGTPFDWPTTSAISAMRLVPSAQRRMWTTMSTAPVMTSITSSDVRPSAAPAILNIIDSRDMECLAELAWTVVSEPSCPVLIAWIIS